MIKLSTHWLKIENGRIFIRQWQSKRQPNGVIHILHGMMEHSGMYQEWAKHLCLLGWDVICHDHPGSGYTIAKGCHLDHLPKGGDKLLIQTTTIIDSWIRQRYPNLPIIRYGHSMGAFLALNFKQDELTSNGIILTGTTYEPMAVLMIQSYLVRALGTLRGIKKPSKLGHAIAISSLNRSFKKATSPFEWVSRMPKVIHQYENDPLCGNVASWGYYQALTNMLIDMVSVKDTLFPPILCLTGEKDPLSNGGKKIKPLLKKLTPLTSDLKHVIVPGAHHKIESDEKTSFVLAAINEFLAKVKQ